MTTAKTVANVSVELFGKDHFSVLGYVECRCVGNQGVPNRDHMRTDIDLHPGLQGERVAMAYGTNPEKYPTILKDGVELPNHDDWSCVDDLAAAGYIEVKGTGVNPVWKITEKGSQVCSLLRQHKSNGGSFSTFSFEQKPHSEVKNAVAG